jgi:hypothetical protein
MTLLLITGKGGAAAPDTANRDVARAQELARRIDDLVVLEADETWWTPDRARPPEAEVSWRPEPIGSETDARRSSLSRVLKVTAEREPGAVVLLLNADPELVKRIHPVAERLELRLLWWHEEPPSEPVVAGVRGHVAGLLTSWTDCAAAPGWLWSVGAGIDLQLVQPFETFPVRPPLRLLVWAPPGSADLYHVLQTFALARGLSTDAHLTIALTDPDTRTAQRHLLEAQIRNLALTQSVDLAVVDEPGTFPRMLSKAHALVDVGGPGDAGSLEAVLAMAYGRLVLSSRAQFAELLGAAPLPLRFDAGDERQLADRMKSLAAAWVEELDRAAQTLRDAVEQEHSVVLWAETVMSIVGFVRRGSPVSNEPIARERTAENGSVRANGSSAHAPSSEQPVHEQPVREQPVPDEPVPDEPEDAREREGNADGPSDTSPGEVAVGGSRWRRRRAPRSGNR